MRFVVRLPLIVTMDIYAPGEVPVAEVGGEELQAICHAAYAACGFKSPDTKYKVGRRLIAFGGPPAIERLADDQTMMRAMSTHVEGGT